MKTYSLRKSKKILVSIYHLWRKKRKRLLPAQAEEIKNDLKTFQEEILKKNRDGATYMANKCLDYAGGILKKSTWEQIRDFVFALAFALAVALLIRQVWFELYEIPTGSMRPTLKEKDRLVVSKTNFGINIPFTTKHVYFDPSLVKRAGIIVFTVENMDVHDPDTMYFWLFPGKKQFVKRMMGRPGDTLYFYGGKIYGIDKDGRDISAQLQLEELDKIDHIPIISFDGNVSVGEPFQTPMGVAYRSTIIHQMNEPVARLTATGRNRTEGEMLFAPTIHDRNSPPVKNFYELWGIGNYGKARIVYKDDIRSYAEKNGIELIDAPLYLEIQHHPDLNNIGLGRDMYDRIRPQFLLNTSIIPLDEDHLKKIFENLYTGRFSVKNGYVRRYELGGSNHIPTHNLTRIDGVPDGMYEYYEGQAYQIKFGGYAKKLGKDHPLMRYSQDLTRKFFNYGFDFYRPNALHPQFRTSRFAYYRNGDLYLMGAPIFEKGDAVLERFETNECLKVENSNTQHPYIPFLDAKAPLDQNGELDREKIRQYGLLIPPKSYLSLGDNFAMSSDSRDYGFAPEGNLRGSPSFIFWPPGPRFGPPNVVSFPWFTLPNVVVWVAALICFMFWYPYHKRHHKLPLKDL